MNVRQLQRLAVIALPFISVSPMGIVVAARMIVMVMRNFSQLEPDVMIDSTDPRQQSGGSNDG